jgi:hypothetical protein
LNLKKQGEKFMHSKKYRRRWMFAVLAFIMALGLVPLPASAEVPPPASIAPLSSSLIGRTVQFGFSDDAHWAGTRVTMGGTTIHAFRYVANLDGAVYEAFCADPRIAGPEHPDGPAYTIYAARPQLINILRYGFPNNARMWESGNYHYHPETYAAYITRVTVAYATHGGTLAGNFQITNEAHSLVSGTSTWQNPAHFTPDRVILINGEADAFSAGSESGGMIVSDVFAVSNSHQNNPVMFRWS